MTLIINNADVARVLTMETTMAALEEAYLALAAREAVCRPRIDIRIPTSDPAKNYQWGTMEGGSTAGYFAIRMKSDVIYETQSNGLITQEKYCMRPGLYCGLILLTCIESGEPLAFINDGHLQHMRVGADGGIGVKYLAKQDAEVVGMLGSGGMARTHMRAFTLVRNIKKLQVFSPTRENREQFGREMAADLQYRSRGLRPCRGHLQRRRHRCRLDRFRSSDNRGCAPAERAPTSSMSAAAASRTRKACGGSMSICASAMRRVPSASPNSRSTTSSWPTRRGPTGRKFGDGRSGRRRHGNALPDKRVTLADLAAGKVKGRTGSEQITYSERGNLQGAQFFAVAGKIYEAAKSAGLGREIPTEWFLQDIRD